MRKKTFLALPVTGETFADVREKNRYYVDKTPYLKQVFSDDEAVDEKSLIDGTTVLLLTRPRRFGKTMLMNMFESFLNINYEKPGDTSIQDKFFKGTKILEDKKFCKKYMGQFPVISITLKDVLGDDFESAYLKLAEVVSAKANEFSFLKESPYLNEMEKAKFNLLCDEIYLKKADKQAISYVTSAIKSLSLMLYKHFNKQVYILIDEYDVPLAKAQEHGYHKDMVTLMSSFLGFLKDPQKDPEKKTSIISKVVITGCLKVAKNSIFTGVNNLTVNTVISTDMDLTGIIGFTKDETYKFLEDYEMDDYATDVKNNYDGYKFCDKEMFCPWDVVNFIKENYKNNLNGHTELVKANNYWANSTSSPALYEYLGFLTDNDNQKMQDLVDGKSISFNLNESMNYDTLSEHNSDDFWSLLLHTGYLTLDWEKTDEAELSKDGKTNKNVVARIPNLEILGCFDKNIKARFSNVVKKDNLALNIANALLEGKVDYVQDKLGPLLRSFVSVRDTATKAPHENYYHGFLNGIFTNCKDNLGEYHSNYESGDGYADITFNNLGGTKACVIEIKVCKEKESRAKKANEAIEQILEKHYADAIFEDENITSVNAIGIAFSGKNCALASKWLKAKQ